MNRLAIPCPRAALGLLVSCVAGWASAQAAPQPPAAASAANGTTCRTIEVRNVRPGQGAVTASAFLSEADLVGRRVATAATAPAGAGDTLTLNLCGLSGSQMSLFVMQDLNGNGLLDRNPVGIPIEPWGASRNPPPFSPPTFQTTQVTVDATPLVILLSP